jgi:hypothetical protein
MDAYQVISERLARSGVEHEVKAVATVLSSSFARASGGVLPCE